MAFFSAAVLSIISDDEFVHDAVLSASVDADIYSSVAQEARVVKSTLPSVKRKSAERTAKSSKSSRKIEK